MKDGDLSVMTDIEAVNNYIVECRQHVSGRLLYDIERRGLYSIINFLPGDLNEAKAVAYARMAAKGIVFGDDELDSIAGEVRALDRLRSELHQVRSTDVDKTIPLLEEMLTRSKFVQDYFKK